MSRQTLLQKVNRTYARAGGAQPLSLPRTRPPSRGAWAGWLCLAAVAAAAVLLARAGSPG